MFDCYHRWLAIPKNQRPPTYYQLLGISPDETDTEVIQEAALRQTSHVRTYQTGPHAQQCQALLNEIGQAKVTLLHPVKRMDYDDSLGKAALGRELQPPTVVAPDFQSFGETVSTARLGSGRNESRADFSEHSPAPVSPPGKRPWIGPESLVYFAILLLGAALAFWLSFTTP
jgi:hypothetical protein